MTERDEDIKKESKKKDTKKKANPKKKPKATDNQKHKELMSKNEDLKDMLLRVQAEFENYKKRTLKEKEGFYKYANFDVIKDLLPIVDNLERAIDIETTEDTKAFLQGFKMIHSQILELLKKFEVEEIQTENNLFDPNLHQAIQVEESDEVENETIFEVFQKGYFLKDKILRQSIVKILKPKKK